MCLKSVQILKSAPLKSTITIVRHQSLKTKNKNGIFKCNISITVEGEVHISTRYDKTYRLNRLEKWVIYNAYQKE